MELPIIGRVFGMALAIFRRVTASAETRGRTNMNAQSERISSHQPLSRDRRRAHTSRPHSLTPVPASTPAESKWSFLKGVSALLEKLSLPVGVLVAILALGTWLAFGFFLGKASPKYMVTVQPFEISPAIANHVSISGKTAADIVVDTLNDAATHASQFHGTEYYRYDNTGAQPVALHQAIEIPVQTSYDIELKGISLDSLIRLYNGRRYQQWIISGDVLSSPHGLIGRIRLNQGETAKFWETAPSGDATPSELIRQATCMMLTSVNPELLGSSYLQQGKYEEAAKVFRQWEIDDPRNWKPSYFLSLDYGYQNKDQEASNLASWSKNIADHEKKSGFGNPLEALGSGNVLTSDLARAAKVVLAASDVSDSPRSSPSENRDKLDSLQQAELKLRRLSDSDGSNVDYRIERAKILDSEALIESDLNPNSLLPCQWVQQAIDSLDEAIQRVPANGGLHEQRAIFLMHLVDMMKKHDMESPLISAKETEEVVEYTRALELRPTEPAPLWGAVYAQLELGKGEDAVDLARIITLLQPDSKAATTAYIIALEGAMSVSGKEPKREKEVEVRLKQLLQSKIEQTQLQALWHAFEKNNYQEGLDLVAAEGKLRFPADSTFDKGHGGGIPVRI
jgi:tetratricopeptide (TPR) repeat protein